MQTPAPVEYAKATSIADAISRLEALGEDSRPVAGGYSLIPMMKLRLARPETVVDLNGIAELRGIRVEGNELVVGAMTTHADVLSSPVLFEHYPIFREAEHVIADPIVRMRGTIGGSMCQADPASDLSAVGSALRGTAVITGSSGSRTVPLSADLDPSTTLELIGQTDARLVCVGFTRATDTPMHALCDLTLGVPAAETSLIQQVHITAAHAICALVERDLFGI